MTAISPAASSARSADPKQSLEGPGKRGATRSRHGHLAYNAYIVTWAERGRALSSELKGRFSCSATRTSAMWQKLAEIDEDAWIDAIDMQGAQLAELSFTPEG